MNREYLTQQLKRRVLRLLRIDGITVNDISKATGVPKHTIWHWQVEQDNQQEVRLSSYFRDTDLNRSQDNDLRGERHAPKTLKW